MSKNDQIQTIVEIIAKLQRPALKHNWHELGLSRAQMGMLFLLSHHRHTSVKQAADYLGISKSAVSQLADPLEEKGLISRSNDEADRRIVRLSLSEDGHKTLKQLAKLKFHGLRSALDSLDEDELSQICQLLQKASSQAVSHEENYG